MNYREVSHLLRGVPGGHYVSKCPKLGFENLKNFEKNFSLIFLKICVQNAIGHHKKHAQYFYFHFWSYAHQVLPDDIVRMELILDLLELISGNFTKEKWVLAHLTIYDMQNISKWQMHFSMFGLSHLIWQLGAFFGATEALLRAVLVLVWAKVEIHNDTNFFTWLD